MRSAVFIGLIILLLNGCKATGIVNLQTGNPFAEKKWLSEQSSFTLPFYWLDGHVIVELAINDSQRLKMALDSGAGATVLFDSPRSQNTTLDIGGQLELNGWQVNLVNNTRVTLGDIEISDLTIIHVPIAQSPFFDDYQDAVFDGAIGYDILNRFQTRINYADKTVTFFKEQAPAFNSDWQSYPMELHSNIPYIAAHLMNKNGQPKEYLFTLDTGAPDYVYINEKLADEFQFPDNFFITHSQNFEGKHSRRTSQIAGFQFAGSQFTDMTAHDLSHLQDEFGVGMLGSGLLRNFDIHFDYQSEQIWFRKNRNFKNHSLLDRSGLVLEPNIKGGKVKEVDSNSDASKKGIAANTIITKIAGTKVTVENFDQLRDRLSGSQETLELCWHNSGAEVCKTIQLGDRI